MVNSPQMAATEVPIAAGRSGRCSAGLAPRAWPNGVLIAPFAVRGCAIDLDGQAGKLVPSSSLITAVPIATCSLASSRVASATTGGTAWQRRHRAIRGAIHRAGKLRTCWEFEPLGHATLTQKGQQALARWPFCLPADRGHRVIPPRGTHDGIPLLRGAYNISCATNPRAASHCYTTGRVSAGEGSARSALPYSARHR